MIVLPAIDLRGGACVQLVGGSYADERVRLNDPREVARGWSTLGFRELHVVDLDAATGAGADHAGLIDSLLADGHATIQVGGGVRTSAHVTRLLDAGAARVIVGTRAIEDPDWIASEAQAHPDRVVVAVDVRGGRVAVRGWTDTVAKTVVDVIGELSVLPVAGFLVTAVDVEGRMQGPDLALIEQAVNATTRPIMASGGIGSLDDIRAVAARGAAATVIGMALYTGAIDATAVAEEFGS